jgi:hypothetical protein
MPKQKLSPEAAKAKAERDRLKIKWLVELLRKKVLTYVIKMFTTALKQVG